MQRRARLSAVAAAVLAGCALLAPGARGVPVSAGVADVGGLTITWDDASLMAPDRNSCTHPTFTWRNDTGQSVGFWQANLEQPATGAKENIAIEMATAPGATGSKRLSLCGLFKWAPGPAMVTMSAKIGEQFGPAPYTPGSTPVVLAPYSPPQTISVVADPCPANVAATFPAFCANPNALRLGPKFLDSFGDQEVSTIRLFNKAGRVPMIEETNARDLLFDSERWLRPNVKFTPGKYLLIATNFSFGKWTCSIYYQSVCHWDDADNDLSAYSFTWTGSQVTKVKWHIASELKDIKL